MVNISVFLVMCILLIILPGPDTAIATKNTLTVSRKGGLQTIIGSCCGLLIHTCAAVIGLSAIIVKSAYIFAVLKYVGAVYLCYLGIKTLWTLRTIRTQSPVVDDVGSIEHKYSHQSCFKQGFLTNVTNPKVAVFFLTFLPQFVDGNSGTFFPFLIMGLIYTALTMLWFIFYVYLLDRISAFMKKPSTKAVIEGLTGAILIAFGIKLALEKAH
ncbi:LysE family translocator [Lysinibacillus capsici]|jgi:RhtB (resistance to homoserine/threonine) family protein|uniref:LysE family translocator n=1 Tax=Lysinibacillus capsici TaxID=2115968 RepID=A0ABY8KER6_9BACI|nr:MULTISPECIES: LysE family translocator [Lysinibacillus]AUS85130.1 LysE family translocator [Lysinibacillus sp. YS11]MCT1539576.1 LysE family translocator [Lysinibacillus capsici]MCT1570357.1 LysE family translocator [Lysinibacillus capsici]MCT1647735.1 LysE family translocator [Lysinibacillus capsici]MCT1725986.1 LysE family translocator [Lysinibacillus capsici]